MIIQKHMFVGVEKKEYTEMNVYTLKDDNTKLFLFWKKEGKMKKRTAVYLKMSIKRKKDVSLSFTKFGHTPSVNLMSLFFRILIFRTWFDRFKGHL
jgi:hypothetical protein